MMLYPALPHSPDHAFVAARDFTGANGLMSFILRPALPDAAVDALLNRLTLFGLGFSWWRVRKPGHLQRRSNSPSGAFPIKLDGVRPVRLHIGLEDPADLIIDLRHGLDAFGAVS